MVTITLYSNNCPKCKILKSRLDEKGIGYDVCSDIDVMVGLGFSSLPMLTVGEKTMNFNDALLWVKEIG